MIKAEEISEIIKRQIQGFETEIDLKESGRVLEVGDGIARIYGLEKALAGELLEFPGGVFGLVLNLEADNVGAVLLGDDAKIKENLGKLSEADRKLAEAQKICPIEDEALGGHGVPIKLIIKNKPVFICCKGCKEDAEKNPDETLKKVADLIKKNTKK